MVLKALPVQRVQQAIRKRRPEQTAPQALVPAAEGRQVVLVPAVEGQEVVLATSVEPVA